MIIWSTWRIRSNAYKNSAQLAPRSSFLTFISEKFTTKKNVFLVRISKFLDASILDEVDRAARLFNAEPKDFKGT